MADAGFRVGDAGGGVFVAVVGWAGKWFVHADSADEGALAEGEGESGEEVGGGDVDGGVVGGCCGAVGEGARDDAVVDLFGAA